jgi:hypothetical protein
MPMRNQPDGVHRARRGTETPPREYDIFVDGEPAGIMERLKHQGSWRARRDGEWPRKFDGNGAYLDGVRWLAGVHRAAKQTDEPVVIAEGSEIEVLSPLVADPFRGDSFADPLA